MADTIEEISRKVNKALKAGYTSEQVRAFLRSKGYTPESWHKAAMRRNAQQLKAHQAHIQNPVAAMMRGYGDAALNAITWGGHDHLRAALRSLTSDLSYNEALDETRAQDQAYRARHPYSGIVGDVGGGVASGSVAAKAALAVPKLGKALTPVAGAPVANVAKELAVDVPLGVAEAGITAKLKGSENAGTAALLGGAAGLAAPFVSRGVGALADVVRGPQDRALTGIQRQMEMDQNTPEELHQQVQKFEDAGLGLQTRFVHVAGPNVQQYAKSALLTPGPAKVKAREGLEADQEGNSESVRQGLISGLGYADEGSATLRRNIEARRRAEAAPLYEQAYALPPISVRELDGLLHTLNETTKGEWYDRVKTLAKREIALLPPEVRRTVVMPEEMPYGAVPVAVVDYYKRAADDLIAGARGNDRRTLVRLRNRILEIADHATIPPGAEVSPYAQARRIHSEGMRNAEAFDLGGKAYGKKSADTVKDEFESLETEAERELYRIGAATEAVTRIDRTPAEFSNVAKQFKTREAEAKHRILFPDEWASGRFVERMRLLSQMHQTAGAVLPRSDTAANQAGLAESATELTTKAGPGFVRKAVDWGLDRTGREFLRQRQLATNQAAGGLLFDPGGAPRTLGLLDDQQRRLSQDMLRRGLLSGALTGASAATIGAHNAR